MYSEVIAIIYIYNTQKGRKQESEGRKGGRYVQSTNTG